MRKRLISILMALVMVLSSFALGFNALASTFTNIGLDIIYSAQLNGNEDMVWYSYTPEVSGTYVFLCYNSGYTHAYLYTKTINDNGSMNFNGLAYAGSSDPDCMGEYRSFEYCGVTYTHYSTSFRLTYHLEAGTTYYYSAGWARSEATGGTIKVRLTCAQYDNTVLQSVSAWSDAQLTWYTDGEWKKDSDGQSYYWYNYSKILQNMTITLTYKDGSTSSVSNGINTIDGYSIDYKDNQSTNHWYIETAPEYTKNIITITVGSVSCDYEVVIGEGPLYNVSGYVQDYITGDPVPGAMLRHNSSIIAKTDSTGKFSFVYAPGLYVFTVEAANSIPRSITITIDAQNSDHNNHTDEPIGIVIGDYVKDGLINGKDYGYILSRLSGSKRDSEKAKFASQLNFTADQYPNLIL